MDSQKLKELTDKYDGYCAQIKAITEKGDALTQEDLVKGEAMKADALKLRGEIETAFRAIDLRRDANEMKAWSDSPGRQVPFADTAASSGQKPPGSDGASVFGMTKSGHADLTPEGIFFDTESFYGTDKGAKAWQLMCSQDYKNAYRKWLRKAGRSSDLDRKSYQILDEVKALQEGIDEQGGFAAPAELLMRVISRKPTPTRVAGYVTQLTASRDALVMPRLQYSTDDLYTTAFRTTWTGEIPSSATVARVDDTHFLGLLRIPVYTCMLSMLLTRDLIEDAAFDIMSYVEGKLSETVDLLKDNMILNGTGVAQPSGILKNPGGDATQPAVIVSGSAATVTADGVKNLCWSLPEQYSENCRFVMNKTNTGKAVSLLKDQNLRYLFGMGLQDSGLSAGFPTELCGYPYSFSGFMPNCGANTYPIIFGDFKSYYLVNRIGFSMQVLNELYAETNQVALVGRLRFGGDVGEPWGLKIQKCSV